MHTRRHILINWQAPTQGPASFTSRVIIKRLHRKTMGIPMGKKITPLKRVVLFSGEATEAMVELSQKFSTSSDVGRIISSSV